MASSKEIFEDMKNLGKKLILCFLCLFAFTLRVDAYSLQTLGELRSEYQTKLKEQQEYEAKSEEAKKEIAENESAKRQAEADIHQAEAEKEEAQNNIDESNEKIAKLTDNVQYILLYLQQIQGGNAYVEYITGATTMTEMVMRIAAVEQITGHIQTAMNDLEAEIKKNEQLKIELDEKKEKLNKQVAIYEKTIKERTKDLANYDKYALDINTQVKSLKKNLDSAEKRCKQYAPELGDSAVINVDCIDKSTGTVNNDGWLKPLNYGIILSEVGNRWGSYHNALDISGSSPFEGTPVYAAAAGVVSGRVEKYWCGGNMLYIDVMVNGVPYTTYYYHLLRFNVNVGDVVDQSTIIGWVGGYSTSTQHGGYDDCTTGAHLHFGVAKGFYNGYSVPRANVIVPPGFPNQYGWRFYSRTQMY